MNATDIYDGYLELHARRAPVASHGYYDGMTEDDVEAATAAYVQRFESAFGVELFMLGRSGRHVCVEDTPKNRRRFARLQREANAYCDCLFDSFRNQARA